MLENLSIRGGRYSCMSNVGREQSERRVAAAEKWYILSVRKKDVLKGFCTCSNSWNLQKARRTRKQIYRH